MPGARSALQQRGRGSRSGAGAGQAGRQALPAAAEPGATNPPGSALALLPILRLPLPPHVATAALAVAPAAPGRLDGCGAALLQLLLPPPFALPPCALQHLCARLLCAAAPRQADLLLQQGSAGRARGESTGLAGEKHRRPRPTATMHSRRRSCSSRAPTLAAFRNSPPNERRPDMAAPPDREPWSTGQCPAARQAAGAPATAAATAAAVRRRRFRGRASRTGARAGAAPGLHPPCCFFSPRGLAGCRGAGAGGFWEGVGAGARRLWCSNRPAACQQRGECDRGESSLLCVLSCCCPAPQTPSSRPALSVCNSTSTSPCTSCTPRLSSLAQECTPSRARRPPRCPATQPRDHQRRSSTWQRQQQEP